MKLISSIFVTLTLFLLLGVSAKAQTVEIYGIGSLSGFIPCEICDDNFETNQIFPLLGPSALYKIDQNSGIPSLIGTTGFAACRGLDIHPETGELYAVCNTLLIHEGSPGAMEALNAEEEGFGQVLVMLDLETGQGTEIGPLGDGIGDLIRGGFISDISFHPDGTLYAHLNASLKYSPAMPVDGSTSNGVLQNTLGIIDLGTGDFEPIGPTNSLDFLSAIGFSIQTDLIQCANFDIVMKREADLDTKFINYFTNINNLNLGTGNATNLGQVIFPPEVEGHFNTITSKDVDTETGIFYAFLNTEFDNWIVDVETKNIDSGTYLVRINPITGAVEIIGQTSPPFERFSAIAVKGKVRAVPTMSEYGLMLTVALFLGAAVVFLRRRQAKLEI